MEKASAIPMLLPYDPNEFWEQMRQLIQQELKKNNETAAASPGEEHLLGRKEIAQHLRISLVTLHDWMKRGLPYHKQRGKDYILHSEVMPYIKKENRQKKESILSR